MWDLGDVGVEMWERRGGVGSGATPPPRTALHVGGLSPLEQADADAGEVAQPAAARAVGQTAWLGSGSRLGLGSGVGVGLGLG